MAKKQKTELQKKTELDLYIILIATFLILGTYMGLQNEFNTFTDNTQIHILLRVALMAFMQFGVAGLGISIVCIIRKESFQSHGLQGKGALLSIVYSVLAFLPYILFSLATGQFKSYLPFQSVWMTREVLASGFPINAVGIALIATAWGFFEGFNYVVICNKINLILPSKRKWLNWGAIICGIMCLVIHGMIGVTPAAILEAVTVFTIIYGMLMAKEFTGSAWGCVLVFIFLWNAF
jgi:hypothetical protein